MKTKEEILDQLYITSADLKILIPTMGIGRCIEEIKEMRKIMEEKGYYVPTSKPFLALTKIAKKRYGF